LQAAGAAATVNVTASAESVLDTGSARIGANVNQREVEGLPINGRQLSQLEQAPGSINSGSGTFGDIRFSGRANQQNVIRYDGVEGSAIIDASPGNLNGEVRRPFACSQALRTCRNFALTRTIFRRSSGQARAGRSASSLNPARTISRLALRVPAQQRARRQLLR
jgi:hypothetical protein